MIHLPSHPRTADAVEVTSEKQRADPVFLTNLINALLNSFIAFREISGKRFNGDKVVRAFNDYAQSREAVIMYVRSQENQAQLYGELKENFEQRLRDARANYGFPAILNNAGAATDPKLDARIAELENSVFGDDETPGLDSMLDWTGHIDTMGGRIAALEGLPRLYEEMHDRHEQLVIDMQGMLGSLQRLWKLSAGEDGLGGFVLRMNTVERQMKTWDETTEGRLGGILLRLAALEDAIMASYRRITERASDMEMVKGTADPRSLDDAGFEMHARASDLTFEVPPLALGADPDATAAG